MGLWQRVHEAWRRTLRRLAGGAPDPAAARMDRQRGKTTEEAGGSKGYDGGKQVKERKRYVRVETLGLRLSGDVTPAHTSAQEGARRLLAGLKPIPTPPGVELGRQRR
jgi:putative transposase